MCRSTESACSRRGERQIVVRSVWQNAWSPWPPRVKIKQFLVLGEFMVQITCTWHERIKSKRLHCTNRCNGTSSCMRETFDIVST